MRGKRWCSAAIGTFVLSILALGTPATAAAATTCEQAGVAGAAPPLYCIAPASSYPGAKGWYAWVGFGGGCGPNPIRVDGPAGVCVVPDPVLVYRPVNGTWQRASLPVGLPGYVHPYVADWRWVYVSADGGMGIRAGWYAIRASDFLLRWRKT
jgi:hypothetical protein